MRVSVRRRGPIIVAAGLALLLVYHLYGTDPITKAWIPDVGSSRGRGPSSSQGASAPDSAHRPSSAKGQGSFWRNVPTHYAPASIRRLPEDEPVRYPHVQAVWPAPDKENPDARTVREGRQRAVRRLFAKAWHAYKERAWLSDELAPVSGGKRDPFGGWAATLVDSLDTLWIMGMRQEFSEAVAAAVKHIDFSRVPDDVEEINIFETTIRYLGGFLSAYDLSGDRRLLRKAVEVGDMIYKAFDTPNRLPITRWDPRAAVAGQQQVAPSSTLVAEIGSLGLELTRLSQLTGDPRWFDAAQRVTESLATQQDSTKLPGLWPVSVDPSQDIFTAGTVFTLGGMVDSVYEYLPKMAALTGGLFPEYERMYAKAMDAASQYNLFRPMTPDGADILVAGQAHIKENGDSPYAELEPQGQHLACFLGGTMALGGRMFQRHEDLGAASRLVDGCIYAYKAFPHGLMPELFHMATCDANTPERDLDYTRPCDWDEKAWKDQAVALSRGSAGLEEGEDADSLVEKERLPSGFTGVSDRRYILRPEAIESVFVLYRTTGRADLRDAAWDMFLAIDAGTHTELANAEVDDVTLPKDRELPRSDKMESFWTGETLKYFYLIFSEPGLLSLDEWVFNTEAHPLKRSLPQG